MIFKSNNSEFASYSAHVSVKSRFEIEHIIQSFKERRFVNFRTTINIMSLLKNPVAVVNGIHNKKYNTICKDTFKNKSSNEGKPRPPSKY